MKRTSEFGRVIATNDVLKLILDVNYNHERRLESEYNLC